MNYVAFALFLVCACICQIAWLEMDIKTNIADFVSGTFIMVIFISALVCATLLLVPLLMRIT